MVKSNNRTVKISHKHFLLFEIDTFFFVFSGFSCFVDIPAYCDRGD